MSDIYSESDIICFLELGVGKFTRDTLFYEIAKQLFSERGAALQQIEDLTTAIENSDYGKLLAESGMTDLANQQLRAENAHKEAFITELRSENAKMRAAGELGLIAMDGQANGIKKLEKQLAEARTWAEQLEYILEAKGPRGITYPARPWQDPQTPKAKDE